MVIVTESEKGFGLANEKDISNSQQMPIDMEVFGDRVVSAWSDEV